MNRLPAWMLLGGLTVTTSAFAQPQVPQMPPWFQLPQAQPTAPNGAMCAPPQNLPPTRTGGQLTVTSPPKQARAPGGSRLRSQTLKKPGTRTYQQLKVWAGPEVPAFVPLTVNKSQLQVLDYIPGGYMALYREPYNSCERLRPKISGRPKWANCEAEVKVFDCAGRTTASVSLHRYYSRSDYLEVQDARVDGNMLYFNEACGTYSREAGGRCSQLVAINLTTGKQAWRTGFKTSNNVFLVHGDYIIGGYGFTAEPSAVNIFRKRDGRLLHRKALKTRSFPGGNHDHLRIEPGLGNVLRVGVYEQYNDLTFRIDGLHAGKPKLKYLGTTAPQAAPPPPKAAPRTPPPRPPAPRPAPPATPRSPAPVLIPIPVPIPAFTMPPGWPWVAPAAQAR